MELQYFATPSFLQLGLLGLLVSKMIKQNYSETI